MLRETADGPYIPLPRSQLDYLDTQQIALDEDITPLAAWSRMTTDVSPVLRAAFALRDWVCSLAGVKSIAGFSGRTVETVSAGDHLDFFLVEYVDDRSLVLTERDRHLDVMTCISVGDRVVSVTSSVKVHNWFGRAYMLPVGIAHRRIVRSMLRRLEHARSA
ncbi:DUF2867 domain-containing protein [uncultured Roseobacter sp.]|uniref:DUF2867 domain-containing protein n=1 Tax=uncultured Roseobacter sp. TaxID=114847 RepID=UPI00260F6886|nr:DUF2867 domain-containing protein [uncultured Roseobacter sp.]